MNILKINFFIFLLFKDLSPTNFNSKLGVEEIIPINNLAKVPEFCAFITKFFLYLYPSKPFPTTLHIFLLILTRLKMPVSTTFILLTSFAASPAAVGKVLGKSLSGYVIKFIKVSVILILIFRCHVSCSILIYHFVQHFVCIHLVRLLLSNRA